MAEWLSVTSPRKHLLQRNLKLKRCLQGGNLSAKASDARFSRETRIRRGGIHRSSQRTACVEGCRIAGVTVVRHFRSFAHRPECQVRAFQHVVNTPRNPFPFRELQLSPTSSHRDQSSLLASALAKQRWRVTRCSSVSSTSPDRASGTGLAVTVRERSSQLRDSTAKIRSVHGPCNWIHI